MAEVPRAVIDTVRSLWRDVDRLVPTHQAQLLAISRSLLTRLEREMRTLAPGSYGSTATASKMLQLKALSERLGVDYGTDMAAKLSSIGTKLAAMGRGSLVKQVSEWANTYNRVTDKLADVTLASDLLSPGLLEHYSVSRRTYGMEAIGAMRREMAAGALTGESLPATFDRMAKRIGIEPYRAERIARTEHSFAVHQRQLDDMREVYGQKVPGWWKTLSATFDDRTGEDSKFVHGQLRRISSPFRDNEGRVYMTPPNRPNDREVMLFVPDEAVSESERRRLKLVNP